MILAHVERRKEDKISQPERMRARFAPGNYPGAEARPGRLRHLRLGRDARAGCPTARRPDRSISKILPDPGADRRRGAHRRATDGRSDR